MSVHEMETPGRGIKVTFCHVGLREVSVSSGM